MQSFATADAFISVANDLTPGCVLLDYCMPGLDGFEAQRLLQFSDSLQSPIQKFVKFDSTLRFCA